MTTNHCPNCESLAKEVELLKQQRDDARARLLTAAGDDLCRLSQEEIKAMSAGTVKIPPLGEFLASCAIFHVQVANEVGVNHNCLTLAQLIAENERYRKMFELQKVSTIDRVETLTPPASLG